MGRGEEADYWAEAAALIWIFDSCVEKRGEGGGEVGGGGGGEGCGEKGGMKGERTGVSERVVMMHEEGNDQI